MNRRPQKTLTREGLLNMLVGEMNLTVAKATGRPVAIVDWAENLYLGNQKFSLINHEYQHAMLECDAPRQCFKKGAQVGMTEIQVLKSMWGLVYAKYPAGVLYLFPSQGDVTDFSKARFASMIEDNAELGSRVAHTDAVGIKRIGKSMLYLRGARSTSRIEGIKRSSSQLKSVPVDRVVFDEVDEMEPGMVDLAVERLSHSMVKEEIYLSTPSVPDYGISKLYDQSDQRIWMIKCEKCGTETCLEMEFPNSLLELSDGRVIRACKKCKSEIFPKDGRWEIQYPNRSKDLVGWHISQLNSMFVDPAKILQMFKDPPHGNLSEFYNSKLGMAYVSADNRLTINDVLLRCGQDSMALSDEGPCAMGVDVKSDTLHMVIGYKPREKQLQICYVGRVQSFADAHSLAKRFNVKCAVVDLEPETMKAREFQKAEPYRVHLADYQDHIQGIVFDEQKKMVKVNRTEIMDTTHALIEAPGKFIIPRSCDEVKLFATQCSNVAKILQEDQETGAKVYRYRKLGEDHYRHALNYFYLASQKIGLASSYTDRYGEQEVKAIIDFDPFTYDKQRVRGIETDFDPFHY